MLTAIELPPKEPKLTFNQFAAGVTETIVKYKTTHGQPPTWTTIPQHNNWKMKTPPTVWVLRMERDHELIRKRGKDLQTRWTLNSQTSKQVP
ncbi:MAG: hypothetical protein ABSE39_10950 [Candidatus Bathyarchaeia archaeon]